MLTETEVKNAKAQGKAYKLHDGGQMYLFISVAGGKSWRLDASIHGRRATLTLGKYPTMTLKQARQAADRAREQIAQGIDPREEKKRIAEQAQAEEQRQARTFEAVALEWHDRKTRNNVASHRANTMQRLKSHILPYIGKIPIADLKRGDILEAVKHTENRGARDLAHRLVQLIGQVYKYAVACEYVPYNVADGLTVALTPIPKHTPRAALLEPKEIMLLLRSIDSYGGYMPISYALKIMPYVFVRSLELRGARWDELDLERSLWTIPAWRMKMKTPHFVPLARQVIGLFRELQEWTGNSDFVFPSTHSREKAITDNGLLLALRRMGYTKEEMSIHGFRSVASTMLNESGAYRPDVIESALAHAERNAIRAAYNRTSYLEERQAMMQDWADYLDTLRSGTVTSMKEWLEHRKKYQDGGAHT